jgi:tetrahydromethanopterin S-methyltransferase subunit G
MAFFNVYDNVKKALQNVIAPQLEAIQGNIKRLDEKIDSKHNEVLTEIKRLDEKIDLVRSELTAQITKVDEKLALTISIHDRLSRLEAKVAQM